MKTYKNVRAAKSREMEKAAVSCLHCGLGWMKDNQVALNAYLTGYFDGVRLPWPTEEDLTWFRDRLGWVNATE